MTRQQETENRKLETFRPVLNHKAHRERKGLTVLMPAGEMGVEGRQRQSRDQSRKSGARSQKSEVRIKFASIGIHSGFITFQRENLRAVTGIGFGIRIAVIPAMDERKIHVAAHHRLD
ncbi:MAG TPA: hypothetical protein VMB80_05720 [Candidatus Acidoferrum sp.]|nr:hypothetical protein [Candidatus Acidoferrum sp.]